MAASIFPNAESTVPNSKFAYLAPWINKCLEDCFKCNKRSCGSVELNLGFSLESTLILIDVVELRLVEQTAGGRYVTLSYVWGGAIQLQLTSRTSEELFAPYGLRKHLDSIPATILDAMDLVAAIGETYLWVDALCIKQDDETKKHSLISQMGIIYNSAILTIMASNGNDPTCGLSSSLPTKESYSTASDPQQHSLVAARDLAKHLLDSKHTTRAWTYQESVLSRRCLYFGDHMVYFLCRSIFRPFNEMTNWNSSLVRSVTPSPVLELLFKSRHSEEPLPASENLVTSWADFQSFQKYEEVVLQYTQRKLSFASDALHAFSGIASAFDFLLGWKMLEGLPETLLDLAWLWYHPSDGIRIDKIHLPSWSWAGWTGRVAYENNLHNMDLDPAIGSMFLWDSQSVRLVRRSNLEEGRGRDPLVHILVRKRKLKQQQDESKQSSDIPTWEWRMNKLLRLSMPPVDSPLLVFEASILPLILNFRLAWSSADQSSETYTPMYPAVMIVSKVYDVCGYIHMGSTWLEERVATAMQIDSEIENHSEPKLHLLLLSSKERFSFNFSVSSKLVQIPWRVYNVMLVEEFDGYFERVSVGQIHADAWDTLPGQERTIVLA